MMARVVNAMPVIPIKAGPDVKAGPVVWPRIVPVGIVARVPIIRIPHWHSDSDANRDTSLR